MEKQTIQDLSAKWGMRGIVMRKTLVIVVLLSLVVFSLLGIARLRLDTSFDTFLPEDADVVLRNQEFEELFGKEEFVFVFVESEDVFSYSTLEYLQRVSEDIENNVPFVKEVVSLANLEYLEIRDDMLEIEELIPGVVPKGKTELETIRTKVLAMPSIVNSLVDSQGKYTGIVLILGDMPDKVFASVGPRFSPVDQANWSADMVLMKDDIRENDNGELNAIEDPRKLVPPSLQVVLDRNETTGIKAIPTGISFLDYHTDVAVASQMASLALIALLAGTIMMAIVFRSVRPVLAVFVVILLSVMILFGLQGWFGEPITMQSIMIVVLVMVISVSYSVHVVNHYQFAIDEGWTRLQAVRYAYYESTWPIFISALTSALGFLSFVLIPIEPIRIVGVSCAAGSFITYIMVMVIVPLVLSFGKDMELPMRSKQTNKGFAKLMVNWANLVGTRIATTLIVTVILLALAVGYSSQVQTNSDMIDMLGPNHPIAQDIAYVTNRLGAIYSYEVFVQFPKMDMAKQADNLKGIDLLVQDINELEGTVNTSSFADLLKDLNMTMQGGDKDDYALPDSDQLVAQYLLLYEMAGGDGLESWVDFGYQNTRISVQIDKFSSTLLGAFTHIQEKAKGYFPEGTEVTVVGDVPVLLEAMEHLTSGKIMSLVGALLTITIVMAVVLKSVKVGLLSMIPNVLPILAISGVMGAFKIPVNWMTVLVSPMIIGIAVDDTVHYFIHFREEFRNTSRYLDANCENFKKIGRALIFTTVILMIGYGILSIAELAAWSQMAILAVVGIFVALLADMAVSPALVILFQPFGRESTLNHDSKPNL